MGGSRVLRHGCEPAAIATLRQKSRTCLCTTPSPTPTRTALDLGRHLPRNAAVAHLDALAAATGVTATSALGLAERYRGARGVRKARIALALMDSGAQSPKETWLRLILVDDGLPAPRTQIEVSDGVALALQYVHDIGRGDLVDRQGWIDLRVVAAHSRRSILERVRAAFARRAGHRRLHRVLRRGRDPLESTAPTQMSWWARANV